ncbi:MAG: PAS domain-containing protein [Acetobacteraceae bacterium]|nr:PAS domain-containing protein [Acetobacteraceae bacterium]
MPSGMERDLAESRAYVAEVSAANAALRRANAELEASRAALAESEARLRLALDAARMATWDWDFVGDTTWGSAGREALYGRPAGSLSSRMEVLAAVHPEDRATAAETIARAMRRPAGKDEFDSVEFRVVHPDGSVRWLRSQGRVTARDPVTGRPFRAAGVTFDVTARRTAEMAAARALAELRAVYDTVPVGLALLDLDGKLLNLNARLAAMLGRPQTPPCGRPLEEVLPASALGGVRAGHRRVVETGAAATGIELEWLPDGTGAAGGPRHFVASLQPVLSDPAEAGTAGSGGVLAVSLMLEDVTERRRSEAKRDLLAREVDHRARNALAVVQAALRLTRAETVPAFVRAVEGRVAAIARAQAMLADRTRTGAPLGLLAQDALAAFAQGGPAGRVRFGGPEVTLAPAAVQPVSMALHELATNALKHGALSTPDGRVALDSAVDGPAGLLRLRWTETGGPPLGGKPERCGFGSRVLEATVRDQLGGRVERDWRVTGLVCDIALPAVRALAS